MKDAPERFEVKKVENGFVIDVAETRNPELGLLDWKTRIAPTLDEVIEELKKFNG
jgi:hypothetical protein